MNHSFILDTAITQTESQNFNAYEFEKNIRSALKIIEGMKNNEQTKEYAKKIINDIVAKYKDYAPKPDLFCYNYKFILQWMPCLDAKLLIDYPLFDVDKTKVYFIEKQLLLKAMHLDLEYKQTLIKDNMWVESKKLLKNNIKWIHQQIEKLKNICIN